MIPKRNKYDRPVSRPIGGLRLLCLVILCLFAATPQTARAHGGTLLLSQVSGPYRIAVFASPYPLQIGLNDVSVLLGRLSDDQIELGANVRLTVQAVGGPETEQTSPAAYFGESDQLFYHAEVLLPRPGDWRLTVEVAGPEGEARAETTFEVAQPRSNRPWKALGLGVPLAALAVWYLVRRRRTRPARSLSRDF